MSTEYHYVTFGTTMTDPAPVITQPIPQPPITTPTPPSIPFEGLYAEAPHVQDRITILTLAKLYHIRKQNFAEAATYRDLEKSLKEEVENAINNLGKSAIKP